MKKYLVILAGSLALAATAAMAIPSGQSNQDNGQQDSNGQQDNHGNHGRQDNHDQRDNNGRQDNRAQQDSRGREGDHGRRDNQGRYDNGERGYYVMHDRGRHEGWYRRGGRVPEEYRDSRYVVTDWRADHLRPPPPGYRWVRSDNNDYLLIAITTGIIVSILAAH